MGMATCTVYSHSLCHVVLSHLQSRLLHADGQRGPRAAAKNTEFIAVISPCMYILDDNSVELRSTHYRSVTSGGNAKTDASALTDATVESPLIPPWSFDFKRQQTAGGDVKNVVRGDETVDLQNRQALMIRGADSHTVLSNAGAQHDFLYGEPD